MTKANKKVTLSDIANAVGVSVMTVSQVLNPRKSSVRVSEETASRINKAARRLNYRPNLVARQLAGKSNNVIGIIVDSQTSELWQRVLRQIEESATAQGFRIQIGLIHDNLNSIKKYIDDFVGYGITNIICMAHTYPEYCEEIPKLFNIFPNIVFIEEPKGFPEAPFVSPDYDTVFKEGIDYLLNLGHKRIVCCENRNIGRILKTAYKERGLEWKDELIYKILYLNRYEYVLKFIEDVLPLEPDALIVGSDESAMWCCRVLKEKGLKVPEDISILSTSKWSLGDAFEPAITSVDYEYEKIAKRAVEMIVENSMISDKRKLNEYKEFIPAQLVIRESCGKRK
jgi:DNA-binding LacI/PurR family transcriptional regulator